MTIDAIDKKVLYELERDCRIADVQLAKIVGKSKDAVRYRIKHLEQEGFIRQYQTWIDYGTLGYRTATLTFLTHSLPKQRKEFQEELANNPRVTWLGVAEGAWNVAAAVIFRTEEELFTIKNAIVEKYSSLIIETALAFVVDIRIREKTFLIDQPSQFMNIHRQQQSLELDELSYKILNLLMYDAKQSVVGIANKLNIRVDEVRSRMQRMERQHCIARYSALPNWTKLGVTLYKAHIYLHAGNIPEMLKFCERTQNIINVVQQLAPWDLELVIFAATPAEYSQAIAQFSEAFQGQVKKIETAVMSEDILHPARKILLPIVSELTIVKSSQPSVF